MNKMDMPYVVGVDVGGQTTKIGVVDMRGQVLAQTVIRTDTYAEVDPYIGELAEAITKVVTDAGVTGQVRGIGMGIPNGNYYTGEIENAVNLKWGNKGIVPVAKLWIDRLAPHNHHLNRRCTHSTRVARHERGTIFTQKP